VYHTLLRADQRRLCAPSRGKSRCFPARNPASDAWLRVATPVFTGTETADDRPRQDAKPWPWLRVSSHLQLPLLLGGAAPTTTSRCVDPVTGNVIWQSERAAIYELIGDPQLKAGQTADALISYHRFFAIAETLADRDSGDRDIQLALVTSNWKLASLCDNANARIASVVTGLQKLQSRNMLAPQELQWLPKAKRELPRLNGRKIACAPPDQPARTCLHAAATTPNPASIHSARKAGERKPIGNPHAP
jgi:hypothetical protein